jgi:hypothetical protein
MPEAPVLATRIRLFTAVALMSAFASAAVVSTAHAQDDVRKRGDKACGHDSRRMCSKFFGDDMQVLACLQTNKVRLAGSCRKFLTDIGQLY